MEPARDYVCVMVTAPNMNSARKLASVVLGERLAACVNLVPKMESHYWWQGSVESSSEVLILMKTATSRIEQLEKAVLANHPYDTPEFLILKLSHGNRKYLDWITASIKSK